MLVVDSQQGRVAANPKPVTTDGLIGLTVDGAHLHIHRVILSQALGNLFEGGNKALTSSTPGGIEFNQPYCVPTTYTPLPQGLRERMNELVTTIEVIMVLLAVLRLQADFAKYLGES